MPKLDSVQNRLEGPKNAPGCTKEPWWAFATSTRFWVMSLGILSIYLESKGWIGEPEMTAIASFSALFVGIRSLDRISEKVGG